MISVSDPRRSSAHPGTAAMAALGAEPPPFAAEEPGPFSLSEPDVVRSILDAAGLGEVEVTAHNDTFVVDQAMISANTEASSRVRLVADLLHGADDATRRTVTAAVKAAWRERLDDGQTWVTRGTLLVTADA